MDARRYKLLEKAFNREVEAALVGSPMDLIAARPGLADRLVEEGWFHKETRCIGRDGLGSIMVTGYSLTHTGRAAYCGDWRTNQKGEQKE